MDTKNPYIIDISRMFDGDNLSQLLDLSEYYSLGLEETLRFVVGVGINSEIYRFMATKENKEKKERSKERKETKEKYNILKNKENILYNKNNLPLVDGKKLSPLEAKAEAKKSARKKPKVHIPKRWIEARDSETLNDDRLISIAEGKGYDWYGAKEMFIDFVDYNVKKGEPYADWYRAWMTWLRNDTKWHGPPRSRLNKPDSVVQSYRVVNPEEEMS